RALGVLRREGSPRAGMGTAHARGRHARARRVVPAATGGTTVKPLGFEVQEVMEGSLRGPGENYDREFRFDLRVVFPALWRIFLLAVGRAVGSVHIDGVARNAEAVGTLELSPFRRRLARYTFTFTADD